MDTQPAPVPQPFLPDDLFQDQVCFITGGGTGLGLQTSLRMGRLGGRIVCASRDAEHHARLIDAGKSEGFEVMSLAMDVRETHEVKDAVRQVKERFGRIDVLVNNAAGNFIRPALVLAPKGFRTVIDIALTGVFNVTHAVARLMRETGGSIVNISAPYATTGKPGVVHSACAKAGVEAMTKTLAAEWASIGIRVNAVSPGPFTSKGAGDRLWPTEEIENAVRAQIPLGRFGDAAEVAELVAFLASNRSPWITGSVFLADGGWSLPAPLAGDGAIDRKRPPRT